MAKQFSTQTGKPQQKAKKGPRKLGFSMDDLEGVPMNESPSRTRQKQNWRRMVDEALLEDED